MAVVLAMHARSAKSARCSRSRRQEHPSAGAHSYSQCMRAVCPHITLFRQRAVSQPVLRHRCAVMAHNARAVFFLDDFAKRQWDDPNYSGTRMSVDQALFMARLEATHASGAAPLDDGYAPFCKHVFMPNFTDATCGALPITEANRHLLRSDYGARSQRELPVLQRWFPAAAVAPLPVAKHLDVILYSREQLVLECQATGRDGSTLPDAPWGVISVKAQDEPFETPMQPITAMRNALGREEGGSGVPIDREAYAKSVVYWRAHAPIVAGETANGD